jgi:transcriptional regulator of acetoin/glycerol metabolism
MHEASARASGAFVALNCAAIPESLIESELFGYRDGAFTGARAKGVRGKIAQAHGGTLFLDEIGDMPLALQTRLLRVLAEREILPLGAERPEPVDLQVICATHRDLMDLVRGGQFRLDLYYRLNGMTLKLPALRERSDRRELIAMLLQEEAAAAGLAAPNIAAAAMERLLAHGWPGNIRELRNTLRAALALSEDGLIEVEHLPGTIGLAEAGQVLPPGRLASLTLPDGAAPTYPGSEAAPDDERQTLLATLKRHRWNVTRAAANLGTCRSTIYRKMERYGIVPPNQLG